MSHESPSSSIPEAPPPRRNFLAAAAAVATGAVVALTPLAAGLAFFLDPLLKRRPSMRGADAEGYLPVANLTELPDDGTPLRFALSADKLDAWNLFRNQTIGTVYLRKLAGQVIAFNDTCPHLGCKVDYKAATQTFFCPCHASSFKLDGERENLIPPRGMDTLEVKVDLENRVWVKYENFQRGVAAKEVI
ncbi:Rieske 2Fe-2S domain-containing protein [bacterium]|nr:Rieske 2Fe-2S domain-containing protein [bacterium]